MAVALEIPKWREASMRLVTIEELNDNLNMGVTETARGTLGLEATQHAIIEESDNTLPLNPNTTI